MELKLFTVVHPIGPDDYPEHPVGWRWAIHTDMRFEQWSEGCINAGYEQSQRDAESVLSMVLITARRILTAAGCTSTVEASVLADCPLNASILDELAQLS